MKENTKKEIVEHEVNTAVKDVNLISDHSRSRFRTKRFCSSVIEALEMQMSIRQFVRQSVTNSKTLL